MRILTKFKCFSFRKIFLLFPGKLIEVHHLLRYFDDFVTSQVSNYSINMYIELPCQTLPIHDKHGLTLDNRILIPNMPKNKIKIQDLFNLL